MSEYKKKAVRVRKAKSDAVCEPQKRRADALMLSTKIAPTTSGSTTPLFGMYGRSVAPPMRPGYHTKGELPVTLKLFHFPQQEKTRSHSHSLTPSLPHPLTHSLTHLTCAHSLPHSLTHLLSWDQRTGACEQGS